MERSFICRNAILSDVKKLSVLYKQVYIQTYGTEGVSDEFANFITVQFAPERLVAIIQQDPELIIVAEHKGNLIGVAEIELQKKCPVQGFTAPELSKLYILEWFCGSGVGRSLLDSAESVVRVRGFEQIWLWVLESNHRAISFYQRMEYKTIGNASFQMEVNRYENKVMLKQL